MIELQGKHALITGGSRGIGAAAARLLAEAGARVTIIYRNAREASELVVGEIVKTGGKAAAVQADVRYPDQIRQAVRTAGEKWGSVHTLVVNAGIWERAPIDEITEEEWLSTIDTNLKSAFFLCREVVPKMKAQRDGNIILVGSTAGQRGEAFHSHYSASKAGLMGLTKSLAAELGPYNIRVNCVAPGWVETDMTEEVFADQEFRESIRQTIPLGRIALPREIAGCILFLASDLASNVHGEVLNANGGSVLCG